MLALLPSSSMQLLPQHVGGALRAQHSWRTNFLPAQSAERGSNLRPACRRAKGPCLTAAFSPSASLQPLSWPRDQRAHRHSLGLAHAGGGGAPAAARRAGRPAQPALHTDVGCAALCCAVLCCAAHAVVVLGGWRWGHILLQPSSQPCMHSTAMLLTQLISLLVCPHPAALQRATCRYGRRACCTCRQAAAHLSVHMLHVMRTLVCGMGPLHNAVSDGASHTESYCVESYKAPALPLLPSSSAQALAEPASRVHACAPRGPWEASSSDPYMADTLRIPREQWRKSSQW